MIQLYSGTPGSGKSFHATQRIYYYLRSGKNIICNYKINEDACRQNFFQYWLSTLLRIKWKGHRRTGDFIYKSNAELTVAYLKRYAKEHHVHSKESQTLVIIDECGIMFNPRTFAQRDRLEWIEFLSLHRHYGFDFILVSQSDRMIDRQIRAFVEYEHKHRKVNNFGIGGLLVRLFTMSVFFIDVKIWYGLREKVSSEWIRYSRRIASLYDTMYLDGEDEPEGLHPSMGDEERGGPVEGADASD